MTGQLLVLKLKSFFMGLRDPWKILLHVFLLIISIGYGFLFTLLTNKAGRGELSNLTPAMAVYFVAIVIALITIVRMMMPTYKPQKRFFPKFYPLSKFQQYMVSVSSDISSAYFFYIMLFVLIGSWNLEFETFRFAYTIGISLFGAHLLRRLIQYPIDFRLKRNGMLTVVFSLIILTIAFFNYKILLDYPYSSILLISGFLFIVGYFIELQIREGKKFEMNFGTKQNIYLKLLINNSKIRLLIVIALVYKLLIIVLFQHNPHFDIIFYLFITPLILYTYILNNFWGFWKDVWISHELRSGEYGRMIKMALQIMMVPLLMDMIISVPLIIFTKADYFIVFLYYFISSVYLVLSSFLWSLIYPKAINSTFQIKGSTSFLGVLISISTISLLSLIRINYWFYIFIPVTLVLAIIFFLIAKDYYKKKKYLLYKELYME